GPRWRGRYRDGVWAKEGLEGARWWQFGAEAGKPAAAGAGRARGRDQRLRVDAVRARASFGLEGLDRVASLLHRPGHKPADGVLLPAHLAHDLFECGAA